MRSAILLGLMTASFGMSAVASARPDLNSFLNRRVTTTDSLINQINHDPQVADRYQRHFGMTKPQVVAYLSDLRRDELDQDGTYTVYSVPQDGHIKMHVERLKKGDPVFENASGKPILIVKCGNPLVLGPSRVRRGNPVAYGPMEEGGRRAMPLALREADVVDAENALVSLPPAVPVVETVEVVPSAPMALVPGEPIPASVPLASGGGFNGLFLLPLLAVPIAAIDNNGGGTNPVPEPATLAVLGVGALGVVRRRRKA